MQEQQIIERITTPPLLLAIIRRKRYKYLPFIKKTEKLYLKDIKLHTVYQITELLLQSKTTSTIDNETMHLYDIINSNAELPAKFLAIAIHNSPTPPPEWLVSTFQKDFSIKQISKMINITYGRLGVEDFFTIMASMLKASLMPINTQAAKALTQ